MTNGPCQWADTFDIDRFDFALRKLAQRRGRPGEHRARMLTKRLFCRMLLETHNPYKPAVIAWPQLEQETLRRLTSLPIWGHRGSKPRGRAAVGVQSFAQRASDPLLRQALEMGALEEARHKQVLNRMVEAYGIHVAPEPVYLPPKDPEWGLAGDGVFGMRRQLFLRSGCSSWHAAPAIFPPELVETFEPVIQEEGPAHPVFRQLGGLVQAQASVVASAAVLFENLRGLAVSDLGTYRHRKKCRPPIAGAQDANFALTGSGSVGVALTPARVHRPVPIRE